MKPSICEGTALVGIVRHDMETTDEEQLFASPSKRRRVPVGFLEEAGKLIVVAADGLSSSWVRNALDKGGQLRVFLHGKWRDAQLAPQFFLTVGTFEIMA